MIHINKYVENSKDKSNIQDRVIYYQQYSLKNTLIFVLCKIQEAVIDYGKFKFKFKQFIQRKA